MPLLDVEYLKNDTITSLLQITNRKLYVA